MSGVNGGPQLPAYDNPDAIIEASILRLIRKMLRDAPIDLETRNKRWP
jgi:hypothetical protein